MDLDAQIGERSSEHALEHERKPSGPKGTPGGAVRFTKSGATSARKAAASPCSMTSLLNRNTIALFAF
jgi:hypothetical protein